MKRTIKMILCILAFVLAAAGCSSNPAGQNSVLEFFGFNQSASPQAAVKTEVPVEEKSNESSGSQSYSSMADLDWDDLDPALVEIDESDSQGKSSADSQTAWEDDPFANSSSDSMFENVPTFNTDSEEKYVRQPGPNNPAPVNPGPVNPRPNNNQVNRITFYRIDDCPVFCPMRELPRTGLTAGQNIDVRASVSYVPTNMSLSIPTLNVTEDIVMVPLVDESFPVESLGENIGLLEGSGPGSEDLFVLAGHNHLNTEEQGPFVKLSALKESDLIFVRGANDASRTFVVYANEKFAADDIEGLLSYAKPGSMILITCEDESIEGGYVNRRVVFAEAKTE